MELPQLTNTTVLPWLLRCDSGVDELDGILSLLECEYSANKLKEMNIEIIRIKLIRLLPGYCLQFKEENWQSIRALTQILDIVCCRVRKPFSLMRNHRVPPHGKHCSSQHSSFFKKDMVDTKQGGFENGS